MGRSDKQSGIVNEKPLFSEPGMLFDYTSNMQSQKYDTMLDEFDVQ